MIGVFNPKAHGEIAGLLIGYRRHRVHGARHRRAAQRVHAHLHRLSHRQMVDVPLADSGFNDYVVNVHHVGHGRARADDGADLDGPDGQKA